MLNLDHVMAGLTKLSGIPTCHYNADGTLVQSFQYPFPLKSLPSFLAVLISEAVEKAEVNRVFHKLLSGFPIIVLSSRLPDRSCFVWGPVAYSKLTLEQKTSYERLCCVSDFTENLSFFPLEKILSEITLFLSIAIGEEKKQEELFQNLIAELERENNKHYFRQQAMQKEALTSNYFYAEEMAVEDAVRRGDIEYLQGVIQTGGLDCPDKKGNLTKNDEYETASVIAIVCRVAISGGVPFQKAIKLSDAFMDRLAECKEGAECLRLRNECILTFARQVAESKESDTTNHYVKNAKQIVRENIDRPLSLGEIAEVLHVNASYLSRIFKAYQGCSLTEYIQKKKIQHAKKFLVYSDDSLVAVSASLGFSSPSYFSKIFKEQEGCSPSQYRQRHKK